MIDHTIKEWEIDNIDPKLLKYLDPSKKLKRNDKKVRFNLGFNFFRILIM